MTVYPPQEHVDALTSLVLLRRFGMAVEANGIDSVTTTSSSMTSPAARCAVDVLCSIFAMLDVSDFLAAQQTCRSWRDVRLYATSWPIAGGVAVYAKMMAHPAPQVQLQALRSLRCMNFSPDDYIFAQASINRLVYLLGSSTDEKMTSHSVYVLANLTGTSALCAKRAADVGAIPILMTLLHSPEKDIYVQAARTLDHIAAGADWMRRSVLSTDVIQVLTELCAEATPHTYYSSQLSLVTTSLRTRVQQQQQDAQKLVELAHMLSPFPTLMGLTSDDEVMQAAVAPLLYQMLTEEIHRQLLLSTTQVMERLLHILRTTISCDLGAEIVWLFGYFTSLCSIHQTQAIIDCGAIPVLTGLLKSSNVSIKVQTLESLCDMIVDCRDESLHAGALSPILQFCNLHTSIPLIRSASKALVNLCGNSLSLPDFELVRDALPTLASLLNSIDCEVVKNACNALSFLLANQVQPVLEAGVAPRLVDIVKHPQRTDMQMYALRVIGIIVASPVACHTQAILDCGFLSYLHTLVLHTREGIREEACSILANMTAGTESQIQAVVDSSVIPWALAMQPTNVNVNACQSTVRAVCNMVSPQHLRYLLMHNTISFVCRTLRLNNPRVTQVAFQALERMLKIGASHQPNPCVDRIKHCEGFDLIKALANSTPDAHHILTTYFPSPGNDASRDIEQ
jgi:importin subunit alpha-1